MLHRRLSDEHAETALQRLEYYEFLERVAGFAGSQMGIRKIMSLQPAWSGEEAARLMRETLCAAGLLGLGAKPPVNGLDAAGDVISSIADGAIILEPGELRTVGLVLSDMSECTGSTFSVEDAPDLSPLLPFLDCLPDLPDLSAHLLRITTPDGEISPNASPELARLSRTSEKLRRRLSARIEKIAGQLGGRSILRDAPPSLRDGRFVLPVISSRRREIKGIVHDRSDSGETVFMEPAEMVEDGNALRESLLELDLEMRKILRGASIRVRERAPEISDGIEAAAALDAIFARAAHHLRTETVFPGEGPLSLLGLKHPLIPGEEVVCNDVRLPEDWQVLIISGPNAGGKSVLIKAVGLAVACSQSGLGALVSAGSTLPHFQRLSVSMGDMQSIADHQSTYSARLSEQLDMLNGSGEGQLALIDEPAAGTDPLTGAALAAAFLEELASSGCRIIVTTHMGQLKTLAQGRIGFLNGCMNFHEDSMQPDYTFTAGTPGSSFTLEIAGRMDFPGEVVERAAELAGDSFRLDRMITELTRSRNELAEQLREASAEAEESRERALRLEESLEAERSCLESTRLEMAEKTRTNITRISSEADSLLARLARSRDSEDRRSARASIRKLTSAQTRESGVISPQSSPSHQFERGSWVTVSGWEGRGIIDRLSRDHAEVVIGNLRLRRALSDLEPASPPEDGAPSADWSFPLEAPTEIDLRGMTAEEALAELDRSMDDCIVAGMHRLSVIHGKGKGILMQAVIELVKTDCRVSAFRQGAPAEGGTGVTVISLKLPGKTAR